MSKRSRKRHARRALFSSKEAAASFEVLFNREILAGLQQRIKNVAAMAEEAAAETGSKVANEPPRLAEFCLALFLNHTLQDAVIGDLHELFVRDCERFGDRRARRLYWARTLKSLWPLFRRAAGRVFKWGMAIEAVRQFFWR